MSPAFASWSAPGVAGRAARAAPGKAEVRIYDYVDARVPVLGRMFERRLRGYRAIGFEERGEDAALVAGGTATTDRQAAS